MSIDNCHVCRHVCCHACIYGMVWLGMGWVGWDGIGWYGMAWMISACLPVCLLGCLSVCLPVYLPVRLSRTCIICINLLNVTLLLDLGPKKQAPSAILILSQLEEVAVEGGNCWKRKWKTEMFHPNKNEHVSRLCDIRHDDARLQVWSGTSFWGKTLSLHLRNSKLALQARAETEELCNKWAAAATWCWHGVHSAFQILSGFKRLATSNLRNCCSTNFLSSISVTAQTTSCCQGEESCSKSNQQKLAPWVGCWGSAGEPNSRTSELARPPYLDNMVYIYIYTAHRASIYISHITWIFTSKYNIQNSVPRLVVDIFFCSEARPPNMCHTLM